MRTIMTLHRWPTGVRALSIPRIRGQEVVKTPEQQEKPDSRENLDP